MNLPLAYRIASMPSLPCGAVLRVPRGTADLLVAYYTKEAKAIAGCPKFCFDNVASFYAEHPQQEWRLGEDIPNWAPLFDEFFIEWTDPHIWNINGVEKRVEGGCQVGFYVKAIEIADVSLEQFALSDSAAVQFAKASAQSRWILVCSRWLSMGQAPAYGAPIWMGLLDIIFVSPQGRLVQSMISGPMVNEMTGLLEDGSRSVPNEVSSPLHILGLGISFCHCKNVTRTETIADRGEKWHKRQGVPRFRYYTLNINPMREVLRREGQSDAFGLKRALHICRGHFATYTEEKPLFGKRAGTFWVPDHVRGSAEHGVVAKDYRV